MRFDNNFGTDILNGQLDVFKHWPRRAVAETARLQWLGRRQVVFQIVQERWPVVQEQAIFIREVLMINFNVRQITVKCRNA